MTEFPPQPGEMAHVKVELADEDFSLSFVATVPAGPTNVGELLPLARSIADAVVGATTKAIEEFGESISCRKGCGACCRNLVAISEVEARRIAAVVAELPEPRRSTVRARFEAARERLDEAGLLGPLQDTPSMTEAEYGATVGSYFSLGLACPFLEDESCSIHQERPITCREYLVTSPPELCAKVGSEGVVKVTLPLRTFNAVARWESTEEGAVLESWVPLVLAPEWVENHPDGPPPKPGPELLDSLLKCFRR